MISGNDNSTINSVDYTTFPPEIPPNDVEVTIARCHIAGVYPKPSAVEFTASTGKVFAKESFYILSLCTLAYYCIMTSQLTHHFVRDLQNYKSLIVHFCDSD